MKVILITGSDRKIEDAKLILDKYLQNGKLEDVIKFTPKTEPAEDGRTYDENAALKLKSSRIELLESGLLENNTVVVAEDSGFEVHALNGFPGIFSRRFLGPDATDTDCCEFILRTLTNCGCVSQLRRLCTYRTSLVADIMGVPRYVRRVDGNTVIYEVNNYGAFSETGYEHGMVADKIMGEGYAYDPIFIRSSNLKPYCNQSREEMIKNSFREKAWVKLIENILHSDL